jgi:hypothetical protein
MQGVHTRTRGIYHHARLAVDDWEPFREASIRKAVQVGMSRDVDTVYSEQPQT